MIPYTTELVQILNTSYQEGIDFDNHQTPSLRVRTGIKSGVASSESDIPWRDDDMILHTEGFM